MIPWPEFVVALLLAFAGGVVAADLLRRKPVDRVLVLEREASVAATACVVLAAGGRVRVSPRLVKQVDRGDAALLMHQTADGTLVFSVEERTRTAFDETV